MARRQNLDKLVNSGLKVGKKKTLKPGDKVLIDIDLVGLMPDIPPKGTEVEVESADKTYVEIRFVHKNHIKVLKLMRDFVKEIQ